MTNTITLPRSVVEQALDLVHYLEALNSSTRQQKMDLICALRAALEQPDHPGQHLDMVPAGWKLVPVEPTEDMLAAVAWPGCAATDWEHMLAAAPQPPVVKQPQVEQEPVACLVRTRSLRTPSDISADGKNHFCDWGAWEPESLAYGRAVTDPSRNTGPGHCYEMRLLYTRPQPKREPLTDAQINDHRLALPYNGEDLPDPWDFKQGVRAAERAHGIGGEL